MSTASVSGKRGPSVLVTDSRERSPTARSTSHRSNSGSPGVARNRAHTRFISVDNVLQYASEVPSGQARGPPMRKVSPGTQRRPSGAPATGPRIVQQSVLGRSTKVSEKLVLIPEAEGGGEGSDEEIQADEEGGPPKDSEIDVLKKRGGIRGKSYAERLPKVERAQQLARVTAYCTAQAYKTKPTATFVRDTHGAKTKLYDDCLYTVYHLPLLPGNDGFRIRSSPILKSPGGKAVLDEEIERSEQRDYHEGYFEDTDTYGVRGGEESPHGESEETRIKREEEERSAREMTHSMEQGQREDSPHRNTPDATAFAEMFIFSYGVVVFWNFTERQEKDILADLTFSQHETGISLVSRPQEEDDFEMEELHFEYNPLTERPRVFNDMITLRSGDHMIKLAMSHAIAQSTKLSFFEERMNRTMLDAQHVPKHLALTGELGMSRTQIVQILGRLFKSRVDVNLSSNILDVPNFFWDSEPTLHPLYTGIREYLEITPRILVLNERCKVFLELAEVLSDSIADTKMSTITWIIIILIVISIVVTVSEVILRFGMLTKGGGAEKASLNGDISGRNFSRVDFTAPQLEAICGMQIVGPTFADS